MHSVFDVIIHDTLCSSIHVLYLHIVAAHCAQLYSCECVSRVAWRPVWVLLKCVRVPVDAFIVWRSVGNKYGDNIYREDDESELLLDLVKEKRVIHKHSDDFIFTNISLI